MSTPEKQRAGTIYTDEREYPTLTPDAQEVFDRYTAQLAQLTQLIQDGSKENLPDEAKSPSEWQEWENGLRQIYKEMLIDAFKELNVELPEGMEVHFAGSLAKAQATEFSDLDAFVIVENEADIQKVKPVFDALNNLCQRIFAQTKQLYPDPIGINPSVLIGTVDSLAEKIEEAVLNPEATAISALSSKPIFPRYALGEQLREKIHASPVLGEYCTPQALYTKAISDFAAPKADAELIDIKAHIMRPIDFILMGIREEFSLYNEDGTHLSAPGTIHLLRERANEGKPSLAKEDIDLLEFVYNQAMTQRFAMHRAAGKEQDEMPYAEAEEMLAAVARLREVASERVAGLNAPVQNQVSATAAEQAPPTENFFSKHASTLKTIGIASLVVLAAAGIGVGLAMGGILAVPLAIATGVAVIGVAAAGYGLFKAGQALINWIQSKNNEPAADAAPGSRSSAEAGTIPQINPAFAGLGPRVEQPQTTDTHQLTQDEALDAQNILAADDPTNVGLPHAMGMSGC